MEKRYRMRNGDIATIVRMNRGVNTPVGSFTGCVGMDPRTLPITWWDAMGNHLADPNYDLIEQLKEKEAM